MLCADRVPIEGKPAGYVTYELPALTAALCRPRAGARNAAPRAPTNRTGKAAGAGRARVAMAHGDGDSTVRRDLAADAD